jgi:energy-coupling factor transporter ATP-binding protein EcfA2
MLTRLLEVRDWDYYQAWAGDLCAGPEFGSFTVVFGPNGSGKSTLVRILRAVHDARSADREHADGAPPDRRLAHVRVEARSGGPSLTGAAVDVLPPLRLFDDRFITDNLAAAFTRGDAATGLFVVGDTAVEEEDRLDRATVKMAAADTALEAAVAARDNAARTCKTALEHVRDRVRDRLGPYSTDYDRRGVTVKTVEDRLAGAAEPLSDDAVDRALDLLNRGVDALPSHVTAPTTPTVGAIARDAAEIASMELLGERVQDVLDRPEASRWVQDGLALHEENTQCAFCANELDADRLEQLRAHFDAATQALQHRCRILQDDCDAAKRAITADVEAATAAVELLSSDEARRLLSPLALWSADVVAWLTEVHTFARTRSDTPFAWVAAPGLSPAAPAAWAELTDLATRHNTHRVARVAALDTERGETITALEHDLLARNHGTLTTAIERRDTTSKAVDVAQAAHEQAQRELQAATAAAAAARRDGRPIAQRLTAQLAYVMPGRDLRVELVTDDEGEPLGYALMRGLQRASQLSDGERRLIALLYFLHSLTDEEQGAPVSDCLVVVDDPVSSLDDDAITAAFAYINTALRPSDRRSRPHQSIVLTHRLSLVRLWHTKLGQDLRKVRADGTRKVALLELRPEMVSGPEPTRRSRLQDMTDEPWFHSTMERAFRDVWTAIQGGDRAAILAAGNSGRQLLEGFIRARRPGSKDGPADVLVVLLSEHEDGVSIATDAAALLHGVSHAPHDPMDLVPTPDAVERSLRAALAAIEHADKVYYDLMVHAVDGGR